MYYFVLKLAPEISKKYFIIGDFIMPTYVNYLLKSPITATLDVK